jgi:hypothetical protein
MKQQLWMAGLFIALHRIAFAQSATILPNASVFANDSADESAFSLKATMTNTIPGKFSTAIRALNYSSTSEGVAIWATHFGQGTAIRASSEKGLGISVASYEGIGIYAESQKESAAYFATSVTDNSNDAVVVDNKGTGAGLFINARNPLGANPGLLSVTMGTGAGGVIRNINTEGNGAGAIIGKDKPFAQPFSLDAHADLEIRHPVENTNGMTGLRLLNTGPNKQSWTFYTTNSLGYLNLYYNGILRGNFNPNTGAYTATSDVRLKTSIKDYTNVLDRVIKMQIKSYQLLKSDKIEIGLLAQDALQLFPEVVYDNISDTGVQFYSIDYSRIGVIAIKAIQEQQSIIEKQQQTIQKQGETIEILIKELSELKKTVSK